MYDLIIRNGTVIDGTGGPRRKGDVAVKGDRIVRTGGSGETGGHRVIDAAGLVVAPGFVDVHNHSDGWVLKIPHLLSKTSQGFTTEALMVDGISYAPVTPTTAPHWLYYLRSLNGLQFQDYTGWRSISDYMALLDRRNVQNTIPHIPYANVRTLACGWGRAVPDDVQVNQMRQEVRKGMEEGAVGVSTGIDYPFECFSTTDEIVEVCEAMAPWGGLYVTHMRYKKGTMGALKEAVEIGRRAGVPVHISHLKGTSAGEVDEILSYVDNVASKEVDFSFDVYPYLPGSTMLSYLLPYEVWEGGPLNAAARLTDPVVRERFGALLDSYALKLDQIHIAWVGSKDNTRYQGMKLQEYVAQTGKGTADALCDLLIEEGLAVLLVFHQGEDRLVDAFLQHPKYMMGTDGIYFEGGAVHPRMYGSASRLIGPLVRDRKLFSLEEAVRKLSGYPSERFGLKDRGVIREGAFADLVVFDAEGVRDRATYGEPHQLSEGMRYVIVNGVVVLEEGKAVEGLGEKLPGRALRFKG
ncbi:MAG: D-aminoacylase [Candidatus Latescibacteria bacterium]|nr:D-aminoacylase [Candidatus Latescibacterota bacterium]